MTTLEELETTLPIEPTLVAWHIALKKDDEECKAVVRLGQECAGGQSLLPVYLHFQGHRFLSMWKLPGSQYVRERLISILGASRVCQVHDVGGKVEARPENGSTIHHTGSPPPSYRDW
jgi:hypothetical protein